MVMLILTSVSAFADPHGVAREGFRKLGILTESSLADDLVAEVSRDQNFMSLMRKNDAVGIQKHLEFLLSSEVLGALRSPQYPVERFADLLPFIESKARGPLPSSEILRAQAELIPRYRKSLLADPSLVVRFGETRLSSLLGKDYLKNWLATQSPDAQVRFFYDSLRKYPEAVKTSGSLTGWLDELAKSPVKNSEQLLELLTQYAGDFREPFGPAISRLFLEYFEQGYDLERSTGIKKLRQSGSRKRYEKTVAQLKQVYQKLPPAEAAFIEYALKTPEASLRSQMYRYLYPGVLDGNFTRMVDLGVILAKPEERFSSTMMAMIESRIQSTQHKNILPIGPTAYAKLIDENPKLAARYFDEFFELEMLSHLTGDDAIIKGGLTFSTGNFETPRSIRKVLNHLHRSKNGMVKKAFVDKISALSQEAGIQRRLFDYFQELLPLFDLETEAGTKFVYHYAKSNDWEKDPKLKRAMREHLNRFAKSPKVLREEMMNVSFEMSRLIHRRELKKVYADHPTEYQRLIETYFDALRPEVRVLSVGEFNRNSLDLLQDYFDLPGVKASEKQALLDQWRGLLTKDRLSPDVGESIREMEDWLLRRESREVVRRAAIRDPSQITVCDLETAVKSLFLKN